ncbi:dihydrolipoyl dehydrogenase [Neobacillus niacini]|uniref:dihydrolipoyl dehydrogenase n=1 Tax=Neobacillus niacini TaxID=86668 RepID=UPI0007AB31E0|nr:dihydrolipoyl dehydrogenase [Neobacillus niacini]MEC1523883.1 dihydrolipoyl dehydrogenase [Neobacillus niacini]
MKMDIIVPKAGLTMTEATVTTWLVAEGDKVNKNDTVAELMTEKLTVEVEAPESGVIGSILKQEGEEVVVGERLATLLTTPSEREPNENTVISSAEKVLKDPLNETALPSYDAVVIGGGPGGYVAAIRIAQLGGRVVLIERNELGGVCLNEGCIPTKTLLKGAELTKLHSLSSEYGVYYPEPSIDFSKLLQKKEAVIQQLQNGVRHLLKKSKVTVINGVGEVVSPNKVNVTKSNGERERITTKNIILATGSEANIPNIPGLRDAHPLTSKEALSITELPESIAIIGAGAIGCEFAGIYAPLGVKVVLIESENQILPGADHDVAQFLKKSLTKDNVDIHTSSKVKEIKVENGEKTLYMEHKDHYQEIVVKEILVATGRKARIESLGEIGLEVVNGGVKVDEHLRTNIPSIYAIGDVTGKENLAHVASAQGMVAAENCMGYAKEIKYDSVPRCIYTSPEIASVGLTEKEAAAKNIDYQIGKYHFNGNGRAITNGKAEGFIKVLRDKKYNQILGIHIVGHNASELISEGVLAINLEATPEEIAATIHPHPTLSEGLLEASLASMGKGIHV